MLVKARIPNAVPYLFTALKIAAPVAVITAFVAEYFGGTQNGLGYRITSNIADSQNAVAWAYVSAPACSGWRSTWSPSCWRASPHTDRGVSPGGGTT